jgi:hypothetical protein
MLLKNCYLRSLLMSTALAAAVIITGCEARVGVGYRMYDPDHRDYHVWNDGETGYYGRWEVETHRDRHEDFRKRKPEEQREYWNWRHDHHD